ncbi:caspase family protein [Streptomyces sp. NBC_00873]|uniref:caspase family protein n=1 Tax=unclassified Streptomyces TaxID=2593676 RepID=UPI00386328E3|nr:caspase family protein [Streptomyces sp. NBC_00873]WTA42028.1 caspase family protein [Streptomyces sp. NBC_00842]
MTGVDQIQPRFPDPSKSTAVLIGTSTYRSPRLPDMPQVEHNLSDLCKELTDPVTGVFHPRRCTVLQDPADPETVGRTLEEVAHAASDVLLVYFAGHGLVSRDNKLRLTVPGTTPERCRYDGVPFDWVREILNETTAKVKILVLDCCYAGRAIASMSPTDAVELVISQMEVSGTYILTSTTATETSHCPPGERHTAFTGELLSLMRQSAAAGRAPLTLDHLYRGTAAALHQRALPRPQRRAVDTAADLALIRPPRVPAAPREALATAPPATAPTPQVSKPGEVEVFRKSRSASGMFLCIILPPVLALIAGMAFSKTQSKAVCLIVAEGVLLFSCLLIIGILLARRPLPLLVLDHNGVELYGPGESARVQWRDVRRVSLLESSRVNAKSRSVSWSYSLNLWLSPDAAAPDTRHLDWQSKGENHCFIRDIESYLLLSTLEQLLPHYAGPLWHPESENKESDKRIIGYTMISTERVTADDTQPVHPPTTPDQQ